MSAARRRFDLMLARATHASTPIQEARTALDGAERVARGNEIPRSAERLSAARTIVGIRGATAASAAGMVSMEEFARRANDAFRIVRDQDGTYRRQHG